ncbi:hypothetical protein L9F63_025358, partial [Diploptera punctata]
HLLSKYNKQVFTYSFIRRASGIFLCSYSVSSPQMRNMNMAWGSATSQVPHTRRIKLPYKKL